MCLRALLTVYTYLVLIFVYYENKIDFFKEKWTKWDSYLVSIMKCMDDMQAYVLQREGWTNWTDYFGCLDVCAIAMGMKMKWTKRVFK